MMSFRAFLILAVLIAVEGAKLPDLTKLKARADTLPNRIYVKKSATAVQSTANKDTRIVDGQPARKGQFPYQASVVIDNREFCGGSLINERVILTAGHCGYEANFFEIQLGTLTNPNENDPNKYTTTSNDGITHPEFSMQTLEYDLCLIILEEAVPMSDIIKTIPLGSKSIGPGVTVTVSGWGETSDGSPISPRLMYTQLQTAPLTECEQYYGQIYNGDLCCDIRTGTTCEGDSGGPLTANGVQVGIVSFGGQSCMASPPVFTRVAPFISWINSELVKRSIGSL